MADMIGDSTMDHKVFNHPMLVGVPNKPEYSCADLAMLATILAEFDTSIDRQYSNMPRAFHLLSANEDLQKMLTEAWNMKSCKDVNFSMKPMYSDYLSTNKCIEALQPPVEPIPRLSFDQEKGAISTKLVLFTVN
jgi:hypothetical protein